VVDASRCKTAAYCWAYGANACGELARSDVIAWQNRFDDLILEVALETGVPAQLLKRLFAQESQFWPAVFQDNDFDLGLGQLTEDGADTTLLWNFSFFDQFCPLVLSAEVRNSYLHLDEAGEK
jgi:hypothetical protein